ncbi:MAG: pbuE [Verrucomicrobiales bacterium]|nr:pbuE [Verrucomicrobiales bacterium]
MPRFTLSERALLLLLAAVQFTHIMDFMIMMPMGPQLMRELEIGTGKFAILTSGYTWSAGLVGLVATAFIDRFDRRPALLVMFAGFILGTLACAFSHSFEALLAARIISGGFGGVSGALVMTIVADVVPAARRAAGIGIVMTAFAVASALGVPAGLFLAQTYDWETPFVLIAIVGTVMWIVALLGVPSLRGHFIAGPPTGRWKAMMALASDRNVQWALLFMSAMVGAHFTIIPFLSPYLVANVGIQEKQLFLVYLTGGVLTIFSSPLMGRLADRRGRRRVYTWVTWVASIVVLCLTNAPRLELGWVLVLAGFFFVFASGRFVPGQAITSLAVAAPQRGAFMSLSSCVRDLVSGIVSSIGGLIVSRSGAAGPLEHYHLLGWIAVACGLVSLWLARQVKEVA